MDPELELEEELTRRWRRAGIDVDALKRDRKGSLAASRRTRTEPAQLPLIATAAGVSEIALGATIGEGGNAIVTAAKQSSLDREVAVKSPRAPAAEAARALVQEGLLLGALEHPNIVPVHLLGRDENGAPLIVLKRIAGVEWSAFVRGDEPRGPWQSEPGADDLRRALARTVGLDPVVLPSSSSAESSGDGAARAATSLSETVPATPEASDRLVWNLEVLLQVCNAVHFAHGRGVVHRDLKPDNVMIGEHGEIYVMDWGSAVRIGAGGPPHVPPAREVHSIEGTPGYMAPEMAAANGEEIGVRTDVYLLGACLHEILVGTPPHDSESLRDSLCRAFWSSPKTYPADVPEELAAICNKAMSRSPSERHPSAAELKREITIFLRHRHSLASGRKARARAELLEAMLRGAEIDRVAVYKLFGECWFGYENALAQWRANREALVGEARLVQAMVRYEIGRRAIDAACSLMNLLRVPEPELARELPALERALAGEQRTQDKLARLGREVDPDVARRERRRVTILLTVPYGVVLLGLGVCRSLGIARPEWGSLFAVFAGYGLLLFVAITRYRKHLSRTRTNRRFVTHVSLSLLLPVALLVAARATGQSLDFAIATIALLHAGLVSCIALLIHRSLAWSAAPFGAAFVAAAWLPPHALTIVGSAALACAAVLAFQWQRGDHTRALQDMPRGPD